MNYRVIVPYQNDMGSITPFGATSTKMESKEANALWTLNRMREHDGLEPLARMPVGSRFVRQEES